MNNQESINNEPTITPVDNKEVNTNPVIIESAAAPVTITPQNTNTVPTMTPSIEQVQTTPQEPIKEKKSGKGLVKILIIIGILLLIFIVVIVILFSKKDSGNNMNDFKDNSVNENTQVVNDEKTTTNTLPTEDTYIPIKTFASLADGVEFRVDSVERETDTELVKGVYFFVYATIKNNSKANLLLYTGSFDKRNFGSFEAFYVPKGESIEGKLYHDLGSNLCLIKEVKAKNGNTSVVSSGGEDVYLNASEEAELTIKCTTQAKDGHLEGQDPAFLTFRDGTTMKFIKNVFLLQ